jgi:putative spermidine/putrescine transport system substrate-binding protein
VAGIAVVTLAVSACGSDTGSDAKSAANSVTSQAGSVLASATSAAGSALSSVKSEASSAMGSVQSEASAAGSSVMSEASGAVSSAVANLDPKTATSAADFGGMAGLVAAAKAEGTLNVIALPDNWANYGEIKKGFADKYGIKVQSDQPDISSAEEIQAADTNKGTDKAPDVFDLGPSVALQSLSYFAPYKVANWSQIPAENTDPDGKWVNDYTGVMSVGYNSTKYGTVSSLDDLKDSKFSGAVALNGNPTQAGAAFNGVMMASLANGGSADDISKGVDYFAALKDAGTFVPLNVTPSTVTSGQTGVVFDWSYNQLGYAAALQAEGIDWKTYVPDNAALGSYYMQAINADAPHPAAARLWQEYLFSDEAQNLFIKGGAKPVLYDVMKAAGTLDSKVLANLPEINGQLTQLTADQTT